MLSNTPIEQTDQVDKNPEKLLAKLENSDSMFSSQMERTEESFSGLN